MYKSCANQCDDIHGRGFIGVPRRRHVDTAVLSYNIPTVRNRYFNKHRSMWTYFSCILYARPNKGKE